MTMPMLLDLLLIGSTAKISEEIKLAFKWLQREITGVAHVVEEAAVAAAEAVSAADQEVEDVEAVVMEVCTSFILRSIALRLFTYLIIYLIILIQITMVVVAAEAAAAVVEEEASIETENLVRAIGAAPILIAATPISRGGTSAIVAMNLNLKAREVVAEALVEMTDVREVRVIDATAAAEEEVEVAEVLGMIEEVAAVVVDSVAVVREAAAAVAGDTEVDEVEGN